MIRFSTLNSTPTTVIVGTGATQQSYTRSKYLDFVWSLLIEVEDVKPSPYLDTAANQRTTIRQAESVAAGFDHSEA
jgi:hypothetical protein